MNISLLAMFIAAVMLVPTLIVLMACIRSSQISIQEEMFSYAHLLIERKEVNGHAHE